jgi:hypothetical protein
MLTGNGRGRRESGSEAVFPNIRHVGGVAASRGGSEEQLVKADRWKAFEDKHWRRML